MFSIWFLILLMEWGGHDRIHFILLCEGFLAFLSLSAPSRLMFQLTESTVIRSCADGNHRWDFPILIFLFSFQSLNHIGLNDEARHILLIFRDSIRTILYPVSSYWLLADWRLLYRPPVPPLWEDSMHNWLLLQLGLKKKRKESSLRLASFATLLKWW